MPLLRIDRPFFRRPIGFAHRRRASWSVDPLESRLMLAADAAVANTEVGSAATVQPGQQQTQSSNETEIVVVDASVEAGDELMRLVRPGAEIALLDSNRDPLEQIDSLLHGRSNVRTLHIVSHGQAGQLRLGGQTIDFEGLVHNADLIRSWRAAFTADADILVYGCETAAGEAGARFLETLSRLTGADVAASVDRTGNPQRGGDWELERVVGEVESGLLASVAALQSIDAVLGVTIRAAGSEGDEQMALQIDGVTVQTWDNIGGNASLGQFQSFVYDNANVVSADQIRVVFTNAVYNPSQGIDRNIRVDSIQLDGEVLETEDPGVFSTGTWEPGIGIVPGFKQSEWLHGNGYFQYADTPTHTGSEISIYAAGSENTETMELWIEGSRVKTWSNIGGNAGTRQFALYQYTAASSVSAQDVQIHFTNAQWNPAQGIDSNLRIDRIEIDGAVLETEDPSVFSTGTWLPGDGIQPGFRQSEWLHANGYFQYAQNSGSLITIHAAGDENTETMELWLGGSLARTWTNVGGDAAAREFVAYQYNAAATVAAEDVQIHFKNANWNPAQGIDNNLRVDRITIDGVDLQTEAANVYSTGTWKNGEITPGFKESEWLHRAGFFEYGNARDAGVISLESSVFNVDEDAGSVSVPVVRTVGSDGVVTVDFATQPLSADAGVDYSPVAGTLVFAEGQTTADIVIPILDDALEEPVEQFTVTIVDVNGGADLLVPRTATVSIIDDEAALPAYDDFSSIAGLVINGDAAQAGTALELTTQAEDQAGSVFFDLPISLDNDASFRSSFSFEIIGGTNGADGLTFTIQNDPEGALALGAAGSALGYSGITNSVAVEFDTYRNAAFDVNDNHVSIVSGSVGNALKTSIPTFDLNDANQYSAWVEYNGSSDVLAVYLSDSTAKPALALLKATVDLEVLVGSSAYFGFTAATGGSNNSHQLLSWHLDQQIPPQDPPTQQGDTVVSTEVVSADISMPTAIDWLPDGTMLIAEKNGVVRTAIDGDVGATPFIDISDIVNDVRDRGLLGIAVHPDFANHPYVYLLYTYDPPEVFNQPVGTLAGPDGEGNRAGRLMRVTADASDGFLTAIAGSEVILLGTNSTWDNFNGFANSTTDFDEPPAGELPDGSYLRDFIPSDSESHTVGGLAFAPDGSLFVSIGDGASYNAVDVRADRVQDIDSLSGKILRIDPLTGQGYADNPFYNNDPDANRSKVYQLGLRNPFRISVDSTTGQLFIGDVGWGTWEEINAAGPGANFGWPFYEGGNGVSQLQNSYATTPEGQAFLASNIPVDASIYALNHQADGINAIVMGEVYRGSLYGEEYQGDVFFNDLGQGIVRHASLDPAGNVIDVQTFTTGAGVVVAISLGPDGALYYVDLDDSVIGRWEIV